MTRLRTEIFYLIVLDIVNNSWARKTMDVVCRKYQFLLEENIIILHIPKIFQIPIGYLSKSLHFVIIYCNPSISEF
jgi:hypothetical protein